MNKGISIEIAEIYLRFPEIMEEEFEDLTEFIEDNHIRYEGATDIVYDLQQENQQLKERLEQSTKSTINSHRYASDMEGKVIELESKLKQRDEVIDEAIEYFNKYKQEVVIGRTRDEKFIKDYLLPSQCSKGLLKILQRYKGDNK